MGLNVCIQFWLYVIPAGASAALLQHIVCAKGSPTSFLTAFGEMWFHMQPLPLMHQVLAPRGRGTGPISLVSASKWGEGLASQCEVTRALVFMQFKLETACSQDAAGNCWWGGRGEEAAKQGLGSRSGLMGRQKGAPEMGPELEGGKMATHLLCPMAQHPGPPGSTLCSAQEYEGCP